MFSGVIMATLSAICLSPCDNVDSFLIHIFRTKRTCAHDPVAMKCVIIFHAKNYCLWSD